MNQSASALGRLSLWRLGGWSRKITRKHPGFGAGGHQHPREGAGLGWRWALSFPAPQTAGRSEGETQQELSLILLPEQCKHLLRNYRRPVKTGRAQGAERQSSLLT